MASRREWLAGAALAVAAALVLILGAPPSRRVPLDRRLSTFRASPDGARALYLTLERLGIPIEQRLTPLVDADPISGPLALLAPVEPPSPRELRALHAWLEDGGTLLYAARPRDPTLDTLGLDLVSLADRPPAIATAFIGMDAAPRPHRWTRGVESATGFRWAFTDPEGGDPSGTPLLVTADGDVVALELSVGAGRVLAISDPTPLANFHIDEGGVAPIFARAAAEAVRRGGQGAALTFDEYHHGARGGHVLAGIASFLADHRAGHMLLQLGAVGLLALLAGGRRFGAPRPPPPLLRRSTLEHVDALARVYAEAGAKRLPRRLLVSGMARRLGWPGARTEADAASLLARVRRANPATTAAAARLEDAMHRNDPDLVAIASNVDGLLNELRR